MTQFVLHAGLPKTGTSTLQKVVFPHHPEIFYLGKDFKSNIKRGCRSVAIHRLFEPILWTTDQPRSVQQLRQRYEQLVLASLNDQSCVLGSWEALGIESPHVFRRVIERLNAMVGDCRFAICLRNPITWLESLYFQHLRGQFVNESRRETFGDLPYMSMDRWLQSFLTGAHGPLIPPYARNVRTAIKILGRKNVGVLVFEALCEDPRSYHQAFADFLNVGSNEFLRLGLREHENRRLSISQLEFIRSFDDTLRHGIWRDMDSEARRLALREAVDPAFDAAATVGMDPIWAARIAKAASSGHRWLADEFCLDLAGFGYAV